MTTVKKDVLTFLKRKKKSHTDLFLLLDMIFPMWNLSCGLPGAGSWKKYISFFKLVCPSKRKGKRNAPIANILGLPFLYCDTHQPYNCLFNICLPVRLQIPWEWLFFLIHSHISDIETWHIVWRSINTFWIKRWINYVEAIAFKRDDGSQ